VIVNPHQRLNRSGFTLVELLVVVVIMMLGLSWVLPQYRRQQALNQLDQYTQQVESGLFHLRARQSSEGTSCEINFDPTYIGTANTSSGFGRPSDVLELSHLSSDQRNERLECCDATRCTWTPPYRLMSQEGTAHSRTVELKVSKQSYSLSPPGTSTDQSPLILLIRQIAWNSDPSRPLPLRCVELSASGHLHRGTWDNNRCRPR
jgi:prepilin-type N-terminal cleavage/methylation domain-containing protein